MVISAPVVRALAASAVLALCRSSGDSVRNDAADSYGSMPWRLSHIYQRSAGTINCSFEPLTSLQNQDQDASGHIQTLNVDSVDTDCSANRIVDSDENDLSGHSIVEVTDESGLMALSQLHIYNTNGLDVTQRADREMVTNQAICDAEEYSDESDPEDIRWQKTLALEAALYRSVAREMAARQSIDTLCALKCAYTRLLCVVLGIDSHSLDAQTFAGIGRLIICANLALRNSVVMTGLLEAFKMYFAILILFAWQVAFRLLAMIALGIPYEIDVKLVLTYLVPLVAFPLFVLLSEAIYQLDPVRYDIRARPGPTETQLAKALANRLSAKDVDDPQLECSTCFHRLRFSRQVLCKLCCGHIFHLACIRFWIQKHNGQGCPICRADVFADPKPNPNGDNGESKE